MYYSYVMGAGNEIHALSDSGQQKNLVTIMVSSSYSILQMN